MVYDYKLNDAGISSIEEEEDEEFVNMVNEFSSGDSDIPPLENMQEGPHELNFDPVGIPHLNEGALSVTSVHA